MKEALSQKLAGKIALVTGAGRGIGRGVALRLARLGADMAINDIRLDSALEFNEELTADTVMDECRAHGVRSIGVEADMTDRDAVNAMFERVEAELGGLDVLVNVAGGMLRPFERSYAATADIDDLKFIMDINLMSTIYACQAAIPLMRKRGGGAIVSISSTAAFAGNARGVSYAMAKASVVRYTRALAIDVGQDNIRANCIAPSLVATSRADAQFPDRAAAAEKIPLRRLGTPEDIAKVVEFLSTDLSEYVTGQCIVVCGGNYTNVS
jgi:NAD(P)-dependent dehydrogenase (short-subunit alcohol dehydrogenase family)